MRREIKDVLRLYYSDTSNRELADMTGLAVSTVKMFAKKNGLRKSREYMRQTRWENVMMARAKMRRTGRSGSDARRKYHRVYEDIALIAERWMSGEPALSLSREYCIQRHILINILNRKGYKKNGNQ